MAKMALFAPIIGVRQETLSFPCGDGLYQNEVSQVFFIAVTEQDCCNLKLKLSQK
jgi:hypothetical protein